MVARLEVLILCNFFTEFVREKILFELLVGTFLALIAINLSKASESMGSMKEV